MAGEREPLQGRVEVPNVEVCLEQLVRNLKNYAPPHGAQIISAGCQIELPGEPA